MLMTVSVVGQEKVGENQNGKFVITENLKYLKEDWDKLADGKQIDYSIIADNKDNKIYYLLGKTEGGLKIAISLELKDNVFYSIIDRKGVTTTCTCSGCMSTGCDPVLSGETWYCNDPCSNCTKSVTATNGVHSLSMH